MVADQTWWHLEWRAPITDTAVCLATQWLPPPNPGDLCQARYFLPVKPGLNPPPNFLVDNPQARAWRSYGNWGTTPGPLYAVGIVVTLFAAFWRARRGPWREAADALMFTFAGFGVILVSVATSLFDYRYAEPAVLLIPVGLALSIHRITLLAKTPKPARGESASAPPADPGPADTAEMERAAKA
jgi:hypothetical protein